MTLVTDYSSYSHSLVIFFLFIEATNKLWTERKKTGIPLKFNFYFRGLRLFFMVGVFSLTNRKKLAFWSRRKRSLRNHF